jgi:hypothetical protein
LIGLLAQSAGLYDDRDDPGQDPEQDDNRRLAIAEHAAAAAAAASARERAQGALAATGTLAEKKAAARGRAAASRAAPGGHNNTLADASTRQVAETGGFLGFEDCPEFEAPDEAPRKTRRVDAVAAPAAERRRRHDADYIPASARSNGAPRSLADRATQGDAQWTAQPGGSRALVDSFIDTAAMDADLERRAQMAADRKVASELDRQVGDKTEPPAGPAVAIEVINLISEGDDGMVLKKSVVKTILNERPNLTTNAAVIEIKQELEVVNSQAETDPLIVAEVRARLPQQNHCAVRILSYRF